MNASLPVMTVEQRVNHLAPLVKRMAYHLMARLPSSVQVDDLIQVGLIGLLDAAQNFDITLGVAFETYATQRIRGAMLDELRQIDWLPRAVRRNLRTIERTITALEHVLGRPPLEQEVAEKMGVPLADYQQMLGDGRGHQVLYYEDLQGDDDSSSADFLETFYIDIQANPLHELEDKGFRQQLIQAIEQLPEREKLVMSLYYEEELNLREIGSVLNVTESRVCQLHSQAVTRLRGKLREWMGSQTVSRHGR